MKLRSDIDGMIKPLEGGAGELDLFRDLIAKINGLGPVISGATPAAWNVELASYECHGTSFKVLPCVPPSQPRCELGDLFVVVHSSVHGQRDRAWAAVLQAKKYKAEFSEFTDPNYLDPSGRRQHVLYADSCSFERGQRWYAWDWDTLAASCTVFVDPYEGTAPWCDTSTPYVPPKSVTRANDARHFLHLRAGEEDQFVDTVNRKQRCDISDFLSELVLGRRGEEIEPRLAGGHGWSAAMTAVLGWCKERIDAQSIGKASQKPVYGDPELLDELLEFVGADQGGDRTSGNDTRTEDSHTQLVVIRLRAID